MTSSIGLNGFAVAAFFALLPAIAAAGAMGLPLLLSAAGVCALRLRSVAQVLEKRPVELGLLLALAVWAGFSALWSPWDGPTALKMLSLLALGLLFAGAAAKAPGLTLAGATAAFAVLAALLTIEAAFDMPLNRAAEPDLPLGELNRNPGRGLVVLIALAWPVLAWLLASRRATLRIAALVVAAAAGALSLQFGQLSTAFGFGAGLLAFGAAFAWPRLAVVAPAWGLAIWTLLAPFLTPVLVAGPQLVETMPLSWAHRIGIWRYTCARILEQPWVGHGIDAGRATTEMISIRGLETRGIPLHPHSAALQIWHDLGAVGAVLAAGLLAYGGWKLSRTFAHDKHTSAAAAAVFAMFGLIANVGWSLWQEWWLATLLLAAALIGALGVRAARA